MSTVRDNLNFDYGDALLASHFSNLAYKHREANFASLVASTGWTPIGLADSEFGLKGFSPEGIGYGINDPLDFITGSGTQSYAIAAKRELPENKAQFLIGFEGSANPLDEPIDWAHNAGQFGWSKHYATLIPLLSKVIKQMLAEQGTGKAVELLITGHSLGGAVAQTAFADLLAPKGNLWPTTNTILNEANRIYSALGDWTEDTKQKILDATSLYTFGAPSFLIEPNKLTGTELKQFISSLPTNSILSSLVTFATRVATAVTVDEKKIPKLDAVNNVSFGNNAFQFAHQNSSLLLPGDLVAQLGSRQPGNPLDINLDNTIQKAYAGDIFQFVPASTHSMKNYLESVIRLVTGNTVLKADNPLSATSPLPQPTEADTGSPTANDYFINRSASGLAGNDLFIYSQAGSYTADGGADDDIYTIKDYDITLTIDGAKQGGADTLIFDLAGRKDINLDQAANQAVYSVTNGTFQSSVTITNWDRWQLSDAFQVSKPENERWALLPWKKDRPSLGSGLGGLDINVGSPNPTSPPPSLQLAANHSGTLTLVQPTPATNDGEFVLRATVTRRPMTANQVIYVLLDNSEVAQSDILLADIDVLKNRARQLFTTLEATDVTLPENIRFASEIPLNSSQSIRFFEIRDASLGEIKSTADPRLQALNLSALGANEREFQLTSTSELTLTVALEDQQPEFSDLISSQQGSAPILDFTPLNAVTVNGTVALAREADYDSITGFYRALDAQGSVRSLDGLSILKPGDSGYRDAALADTNRVEALDNLETGNRQTQNRSFTLNEKSILAPFAIVNGNTFFAYVAANADGISHFRSLGNNSFGLEDTRGGGDRDYDDLVLSFSFADL